MFFARGGRAVGTMGRLAVQHRLFKRPYSQQLVYVVEGQQTVWSRFAAPDREYLCFPCR